MIRVFTAIQFPDEIKHNIGQSIDKLVSEVGERTVRWVKPSLYHLTLKFLGDVAQSKLDDISPAINRVAAEGQSFQVKVGGFGVFPNLRKPRVLWVGLDENSGSLESFKSSLEQALEPLGFDVERRKFHPHVTVGRIRRGASRSQVEQLSVSLESYRIGELGTVAVDQVELVQSDLTPTGPIYTTLERFPLGNTA
ncbi:MAG: RNA 2',3'-cyclic phosphodiesterase [Anaerolineales bacterium]